MRGRMYARDRRDIALYRRRLLTGLHLGTDKFAHGVGIRGQKGLAHRLAVRLEYRAIRLLRAQRIGGVSALRHRLPFEQVRQRAVKQRLRSDRHGPEFRAPLGHFHLIHRFSKEIKNRLVMITVIINDRWQLSKWARQSRIEEFRRTPASHPRRWVVHICATCSMSCCFSEQQLKSECSLISSLIYLLSGGRPSSLGRCEQSHPKLSVNEMCQGALHRRCLSR